MASARVKPAPRSQETASTAFQRTRQAHASETAQDYAEAIEGLKKAKGAARVIDLARLLGVSHVTVVRTIARLRKAGVVEPEGTAGIELTAVGKRMAREAHARHKTVAAMLRALGVPAAVAEVDAEGIEHHVSAQTLAAFRKFLKR